MCGIAGFNWSDGDVIKMMADSLRHRGPDDEGYYLDERVSLGHRRLSIIDLSEKGHQPMRFEHLVIVYNGEVYNFQEIKEQLQGEGYKFVSGTDTEVVLAGYHRWGPRCVEKFNGMWAFCIYDKKDNILFLSRDRFGIKPLYYYFDGERFIFASELKAVRQHRLDLQVDKTALNFFFYQKYIGGDRTIFANCFKLQPSENLIFDLERRQIRKSRYYNLEEEIAAAGEKPLAERINLVEESLCDAVEKRLIADVPVGSFLSGGVDSSLISAIIAGRHDHFDTFSIGFKDQSYDEVPYSQQVSEHIGTEHHVEYLDIDEALIEKLIAHLDEPYGDSSLLPTYLLSKITRQMVTVSLSGDAGDEVFGGYDSYQALMMARYIPPILVRWSKPLVNLWGPSEKKLTTIFKMKKFVEDYDPNINKRHLDWMATFTDRRRRELLTDQYVAAEKFMNFGAENSLLSVQLNDIHNYLPEDILKKVDTASMANSLEARVPFLDHRLAPVVLSLPEKYKIRCFRTKWLLKQMAGRYLPAEIVKRKKRGFTVPVSRWIKNSDLIRDYITGRRNYPHGLIDFDHVQSLFAEHINGKKDQARRLWLVFVFNYWWDRRGGAIK
ncbi:asparagine synthase (glutamine-hydrolyzing) [Planctomycetota bacterium]